LPDYPLTPKSHKDGKSNGCRIIEQIGGLGISAAVLESPVGTAAVTHRTHSVVTDDWVVTNLRTVGEKNKTSDDSVTLIHKYYKQEISKL
jgi:hypothetical protein